jgi:hypothetical protein
MRCSKCEGDGAEITGGYCRKCSAEYQRGHRDVEKRRAVAQFKARVLDILEAVGEKSAVTVVRQIKE